MSHSNAQLYRWERISNPRVYSRSQRVTTETNIQDWIRTVETASEKAAAVAFDRKCDVPTRRHGVKAVVQARVQDAQIHEAAYSEAQDLLNQWVNDTIKLDADTEFSEETWTKKTQADIKREWDHLLSDDVDLEIDELIKNEKSLDYSERLSARSKDPYSVLKRDQDDMVAEVLERMYDTDVIKETFTRDLGLDNDVTKYPDPRTKMALRHQQVKENREKRLREKGKKLKGLQATKDAHFCARKILMKEEQFKENRKKKEEQDIQAEMVKIRKEMEEERKRQEEERLRMKKEWEKMDRRSQEEYERRKSHEDKAKRKSHFLAEEKRRLILNKMQEIENRRAIKDLKIKQKCFSAWYNMVINKRLGAGKAKATRDWRLLLRTFNAWKSYVREETLVRETWAHEEGLKQFNRKTNVAVEYWRHTVLRKCVTAWQLFVAQQQTARTVNKEQKMTKHKMAAFLQAAASGKLWSARDESQDTGRSAVTTTLQKVQTMFEEGRVPPTTDSPNSTTRTPQRHPTKYGKPTDGWLINRKGIQVTQQEIDTLTKNKIQNIAPSSPECTCKENESGRQSNDTSPCAKCQESSPERLKQKPWQKAPFVVSNFEHRHAAQQKILEMQQKQIKEQQKLIEELQYLQKQQMLQQNLLQEESSKLTLNKGGNTQGVETIHKTLAHLHMHISKLQQQLTASYDNNLECGPKHSTIQEIQVADLENSEFSPKSSVLPSDSLRLDLSHFDDQPVRSASDSNLKKSGAACQNENNLGQTKVISKQPHNRPSSVRSDASSHVSCKTSSTARTGASKHDHFLKSMEERAKERERIKKERDGKKSKEEELKMIELFAREQEIRRHEEEEKQKRIEAFRDKKRAEKQREKEKQHFVERMKILHERATEHYNRSLLKWRGIYAFKKLLGMSRQNAEHATEHYRQSLSRKVFLSWRNKARDEVENRNNMADKFNNYLLVKTCFRNWTKYKEAQNIQMEKAQRLHESNVKLKVLRIWADFAAEEKVSMWHKERFAREHNIERMKKKYFRALRRFPMIRKDDEARELRRVEMRRKVAGMLGDYDGITKSQSHDF